VAKSKNPTKTDNSGSPAAPSPLTSAAAGEVQLIYGHIAQQRISGPIPSPDILKQYEALSAGLANRLVDIAEREADHRRKVELEALAIQGRDQHSYRRSEMLGQVFGFGIAAIAISGAVYSAVHGAQIAASFIGTTGVGGLVSAFIYGRTFLLRQKKQEFDQAMQVNAVQSERSKQTIK
jgi:uncharacterized membrane protein